MRLIGTGLGGSDADISRFLGEVEASFYYFELKIYGHSAQFDM